MKMNPTRSFKPVIRMLNHAAAVFMIPVACLCADTTVESKEFVRQGITTYQAAGMTIDILWSMQDMPPMGSRLRFRFMDSDICKGTDAMFLQYPIYRICFQDLTHDGIPELCIGVVKPTRFDPEVKKRLFIYSVRDFKICPLWLGSRLVHDIVDFKTVSADDGGHVISLERMTSADSRDFYFVGRYRYEGFGLKLIAPEGERMNADEALSVFNLEK